MSAHNAIDLAGHRSGAVEVVGRAGKTLDGRTLWACFCHACKRRWTMRTEVLRRGVNSCGCRRGPLGEANKQHKLTAEAVRSIRARAGRAGVTRKALAAEYGVTANLICKVILRNVWAHLPEEAR